MRSVSVVTLVLLAGASASCGGSSYTSPGAGGGHTLSVAMTGVAFSPSIDTVAAGSTVTWTNDDGFAHTVTSSPGSADTYDSGNVASSGTYPHTFNNPGTYAYYCQLHGTPSSGMRGTIVVQ